RMEMALGCEEGGFESVAARIGSLVKPEPPAGLGDMLAKARQFMPLLRVPPKRKGGRGACQEVVLTGSAADLTSLPLLRCWPLDGDLASIGYPAGVNDGVPGLGGGAEWEARWRGRYITLAGVHTVHADDADDPRPPSHNIGMYRVQLLGKQRAAMHWHMHHDGARHWRSWKAKGERMPVAIVLGGESVLPYAATAPLPPGISELLLAGFLNGGGIPMVRGVTVPLWVPANAEIVIEGFVSAEAGLIGWDPRRPEDGPLGPGAVFEGPFGDHTGFYSMPDRYPVLEVTAITHRRNAIYPTTIVGLPPQEDYYLGKATERLFLPLLKTVVHDVEDYDLPQFGAFHNCAAIRIRKGYPLQARRMMHSVWGAGQMAWTKAVIVVDDDCDVHDTAAVLRRVGELCIPGRDIEQVRGPLDILDHAAPFVGAGAKMGLDATRKVFEAERHRHLEGLAAELCSTGDLPQVTGAGARAAETRVKGIDGVLDARIPEELGGWWLFVRMAKRAARDGERVIKALGGLQDGDALPRWTVVVGEDADASSFDDVMFHWAANIAPERDMHLSKCGRRVAFDATPKVAGDERNGQPVRDWPPILKMDDAVIARVKTRWIELGLYGTRSGVDKPVRSNVPTPGKLPISALPPFLETRELGRMPLVMYGRDGLVYEYTRPSPGGSRQAITFMVCPPRSRSVDAAELAADVDRFWTALWSSLSRLAEQASQMVSDSFRNVAEAGEEVPDPATVLTAQRLYVVEYDAGRETESPCTLTFDVHELECREILELRTTSDFRPISVTIDG
ncbi:MAG TPA: UbiD family decarboxylase, partial [Phycisphaerales bacterium]|nr:UbiD family decarboxylase [Phycisphaerales bacterium]